MDLNRGYPRKKLSLKRNKCSQENAPPETADCSIEDERQFKITRFVKDVNTYLEEKEHQQSRAPKHGTLLNILQSKGCTRGDLGKEMKSKLDQNLRQIIGLEDKKDCHCNCKKHRKNPTAKSINKPVVCASQAQTSTRNETFQPLIHTTQEQQEHLYHQPHRTSPSILNSRTPRSDHISPRIEVNKSATKTTLSVDDLDNKLYPEFIRIVTNRCLQFKSAQFKGNNYANSLKEKLLAIYKDKRRECCSEECLSERPRSNAATSPMSSISAVHEQIRDSDPPFTLNFVSERSKSIKQILQESIGPGSSVNESHYRDDESCTSELNHTYCPPMSEPCEQYLVTSRRELPRYELPLLRVTRSPVYKYPQMTVDGGGDRILLLNENNAFLPPCDEESPEFKYYPRRMY